MTVDRLGQPECIDPEFVVHAVTGSGLGEESPLVSEDSEDGVVELDGSLYIANAENHVTEHEKPHGAALPNSSLGSLLVLRDVVRDLNPGCF